MFTDFDRRAMSRALALAEKGLESAHPNPRVGCVIAKGERVIAEGWHERTGEAHAEAAALLAATESVEGATAYVTLEPCSHYGRTPPCANALIDARIARVVFAVQDPDPRVSGKGAELLRRAGIKVETGLMEAGAVEMNIGFMKRLRSGVPWTTVKLAMSLDGRTALANGESQWITGEQAREDVQHWRARSSVVITGVGTVLADNPLLNVRLGGDRRRQPGRVVLDTHLRTPPNARLFESGGGGQVVVYWGGGADAEARRAALINRGARVEIVPLAADGRLNLKTVLELLARAESVNEVLVEAGATLAGRLITEGLVDELLLYVAPKLLGPDARPLVQLPQLRQLSDASRFSLVDAARIGDDLRLRLRQAS